MRELKFRGFSKSLGLFVFGAFIDCSDENCLNLPAFFRRELDGDIEAETISQYTGLNDKNGLTCIYEGDIIDSLGNIKGNIYEMDKGETDIVIQGFGTKTWCETYRRAILLGCIDSE